MQYVSTCWRETLRVLHCNYPTDVLWVIDCIVIAIELLLNYLYGILYFIKVIIVQQIIGNVSKSNHHDIFYLAAWCTFLSKHLLCHKQLQNSWDHISSVVALCWFCFEDAKSENLVVFDTNTCIRILVWLGWTNYSFLITPFPPTLLTYGWSCLNTI